MSYFAYTSHQVEETLYRVHTYFFTRDSPHFMDLMINDQTKANNAATGEPLFHLDSDVKSVDFERFLSILYPPCVTCFLQWSKVANDMLSEFGKYVLTKLDEWTSVLHLASKWGFESICSLALRELLPLASPVDKIVLGRKYGFDDWLTPAFVAVCARAEPLSLAEAEKMSNGDVTRIFQARERARSSSAPVATMVAEDAVACVFVDEEVTFTSATGHVHDATDLPACVDDVDGCLMDALKVWPYLCTWFNSPGYPPNMLHTYPNFQSSYEVLLTSCAGPRLRAISLRQFLSTMLQTEMLYHQSDVYLKIFTDLCDRVQATMQDIVRSSTEAPLGKAELRQILNEQCLGFISYQCAFDGASDSFVHRRRSATLLTQLADAGLLDETTLRASFFHVVGTLPHLPDTSLLRNLCIFLTNHGKVFDRNNCRDLMDDVFTKLRKHAMEWRCQPVQDDIVVSAAQSSRTRWLSFCCLSA
jgi:hypothetical protein